MSQTEDANSPQIYPKVGDPLIEEELKEGELNCNVLGLVPVALLSGPVTVTNFQGFFNCCCARHVCHIRDYTFLTATAISGVSLWIVLKLARTRISTVVSFLKEPMAVTPLDVVFSTPSLFLGAALFAKIFI